MTGGWLVTGDVLQQQAKVPEVEQMTAYLPVLPHKMMEFLSQLKTPGLHTHAAKDQF